MMVHFDPKAEELGHLQVGPLGPHVESFAALLLRQGYCPENGWQKIRLVADFSRGGRFLQLSRRKGVPSNRMHSTAAWARRKSCSRKSTFPCPISDPAANLQ